MQFLCDKAMCIVLLEFNGPGKSKRGDILYDHKWNRSYGRVGTVATEWKIPLNRIVSFNEVYSTIHLYISYDCNSKNITNKIMDYRNENIGSPPSDKIRNHLVANPIYS